jgi:hypothetical protein
MSGTLAKITFATFCVNSMSERCGVEVWQRTRRLDADRQALEEDEANTCWISELPRSARCTCASYQVLEARP